MKSIFVFICLFLATCQGYNETYSFSPTCKVILEKDTNNSISRIIRGVNCDCNNTWDSTLLSPATTFNLTHIDLSYCNFSGAILSNVSTKELITVYLQGNNFYEKLPDFPFTRLKILNIANNQYYGKAPTFSSMELQELILANNSLEGSLNDVLPIRAVRAFSIAGNHFHIPSSKVYQYGNFTDLPPYILPRGVRDGIVQLDCIMVFNDSSIPPWCVNMNSIGGKCFCPTKCGNGYVEKNEICEPNGKNASACCSSSCTPIRVGEACEISESTPCEITKCSINGTCEHNTFKDGDRCRDPEGECDLGAFCDGTGANCPPSKYQNNSFICRGATGQCDLEELCTGDNVLCPSDNVANTSVICRPKNDTCDEEEFCNGQNKICPPDNFASNLVVCRNATTICDIAENCTGLNRSCPDNTFASNTVVCNPKAGQCDIPENCTGNSDQCPKDKFIKGVMCRNISGDCDQAEVCTGYNATCPDDVFLPIHSLCRRNVTMCDITEYCLGNSSQCPNDTWREPGFLCRPAINDLCDFPEYCTGVGSDCGVYNYYPSTKVCYNESCHVAYCDLGDCRLPEPICNTTGICNTDLNSCECKNTAMTYPNCNPCGDGFCDSNLENCVNCPADCLIRPCNLCGDSYCNSTIEDCTSCYQDCHESCNSKCVPECEVGRGSCISGVCQCISPFTGPTCSNVSQPVIVDNNNSTPSVSVQVQGLNSAKFYISLLEIYEKDPQGSIYNSADLTKANYTLVVLQDKSYTFWNYSTFLHQSTFLQIYIYYFNETTEFEGNTITANTIKLAMSLSYWPFKSLRNSLFVVFSNDISNNNNEQIEACKNEEAKNPDENVRWYKITVDGVSLYALMEEFAIIDGVKQAITFARTSATNITIHTPFFWSSLSLDPNFGLLLSSDNSCDNNNNNDPDNNINGSESSFQKWKLSLIAIPIVVIVVFGVLMWKYDSFRLWKCIRKSPNMVIDTDHHEEL